MIYNAYKFSVPQEKQIRVITDTDAKNEADDQFAIVQTLLSPKFNNVGMIASHYGTGRHQDSMERSFQELETILVRMNFYPDDKLLFRGAGRALEFSTKPIDSEGAQLIIREAMKDDARPLFLTIMGPITNLASALLIEPRIAGRLTAIWIGGGQYPNGGTEFNLGNDIIAANVVFESKVSLWQVPKNVYEMMGVSLAELEYKVRPCGAIGAYLCEQLEMHSHEEGPRKSVFRTGETWVLGDNPAVGLLLYEHRFLYDWVSAPYITSDMHYVERKQNRPIRVYRSIDNRLILEDLFAKLALFAQRQQDDFV